MDRGPKGLTGNTYCCGCSLLQEKEDQPERSNTSRTRAREGKGCGEAELCDFVIAAKI